MILDVVLVLALILAAISGSRSGFVRRFWAGIAFVGGLFVGRWLSTYALGIGTTPEQRGLIAVSVVLGCALLLLTVGELIGSVTKRRLVNSRFTHVNQADIALGSAFSVVVVLVGVWLLSSVLGTMPSRDVTRLLQSSRIITGITQLLPPAPHAISDLSYIVDPNRFPDVFLGNEPIPAGKVNLPELGAFETVVNATKASVVRIKGQGCGGVVSGSGFVVGSDLVMTNAHVVAGIKQPFVQDTAGSHRATTVWFDPQLDLAIMRTRDLAGSPLSLTPSTIKSGTQAVALGYPDGGDLSVSPAAVLRALKANGRDIYNRSSTVRDVYEVQASITQGNSGGPLINTQGEVIGVIFAESTTYQELGYALTNQPVIAALAQVNGSSPAVNTGQCTT